MRTFTIVSFVSAVAFACPPVSLAQTASSPVSVSFGTGAVSSSSSTRATFAGTINVDVSDRAAVEGETRYLDRGPGADALSVTGSFLVDLVAPQRRVVPFAMVGAGIYRASFDMNNQRFMGASGSQFAPGSMLCAGYGNGFQHMGSGPHGWQVVPGTNCPGNASGMWGIGQMPMFYAERMGAITMQQNGMWPRRSFTDPAMTIGGGIKLRSIGHLTLRADARALVLFAGGDTHTLGLFGFNVGYRF